MEPEPSGTGSFLRSLRSKNVPVPLPRQFWDRFLIPRPDGSYTHYGAAKDQPVNNSTIWEFRVFWAV